MAFFASKPAPNITEGLLVFVQLVMEEITTDPDKNEIKVVIFILNSHAEIRT